MRKATDKVSGLTAAGKKATSYSKEVQNMGLNNPFDGISSVEKVMNQVNKATKAFDTVSRSAFDLESPAFPSYGKKYSIA